jgi:mevalonate kinase
MSGEATVSAPGKTILFGEHAAVYGHPALVTALDRRMRVSARTSASIGRLAVRLEIPSLGIDKTIASAPAVHAAKEPGHLAVLAVTTATEGLGPRSPGIHLRIDSDIPLGAGFGSSAALAVCIVAACRRACGDDIELDEIARLALAIERHQHGRASGVDVQAVLRGGVLWCRRRDDGGVEYESLRGADKGLDAFRLFDTGAPNEPTGDMVRLVQESLDREPARVRESFTAIASATRDGRIALAAGDTSAFVAIVKRAERALEALGVVPPVVAEAIRGIEADGGAAKISGAGGLTGAGAGLVLVVHPDPHRFAQLAPPPGWTALRIRLGAEGLRSEVAA